VAIKMMNKQDSYASLKEQITRRLKLAEDRKPIFVFTENKEDLRKKLTKDLTSVKKIDLVDGNIIPGSTVYIIDDENLGKALLLQV
jgi:hypothetical protein